MIHLRVASEHSTHFGTARPEQLITATSNWDTEYAVLTDRDTLAGSVRHIRACLAADLKPVLGVELLVLEQRAAPSTITLLAHGHNGGQGWAGLSRLVSAAHMGRRRHRPAGKGANAHRPFVSRSAIQRLLTDENKQPCATILLGPESDVGRKLLAGNAHGAAQALAAWKKIHGDLVIEVVCHFTPPGNSGSLAHAAALLEFAYEHRIPAVITNAVRYLEPGDAASADLLDAVGLLLPLGQFQPQPNDQAWLKPPQKMLAVLREVVSYSNLGAGTVHEVISAVETLAQRCALDPVADLKWRQPKLPELSMLGLTSQDDPAAVLTQKVKASVPQRFPYADQPQLQRVHDRLEAELQIIQDFNFSTYFLTVADITDLIRAMGVRVQGRGSGAGSMVNYLLGVSPVDPLEHGLLFERFLGQVRSTLPDVDLDVESARRHEIYHAIFNKYGSERTTLLSMANRYRGRGAVRDAGLALGISEEHIDLVAKHIWRLNAGAIEHSLETKPELQPIAKLVANDPKIAELIDMSARLDRMPRHLAMHPCGVIISDANLLSLTPIQPSGIPGIPMSQFDKDDIDDLGLLKLDVLGVRMQSAIAHCLEQIRLIHGPNTAHAGGLPSDVPYISREGHIDLASIPTDDPATFEAIRSTHTVGMFQIESPGQRELIGRLQPDRYDDLIADIALFRPGPMKGNMVEPFLRAKHHPRQRRWLHPELQGPLSDTYGSVIFHEHVMHILSLCMGISLAQADELRRQLGSTQDEEISEQFRQAALQQLDSSGNPKFSAEQVAEIWSVVAGFGSFGFCKAHGAAFAITTWQTAWLKTHYPAHFMAGLLEHDPGMYPKRLLVAEAKRMGLPVLPIDVTKSAAHVKVEPLAGATPPRLGIRLALTGVRQMSQNEVARIFQTRPHRDLRDLIVRAKLSKPTVQHLASIGALDSLAPGLSRGQVIALTRQITALKTAPPQLPGQSSLDLTSQGQTQGPDQSPSSSASSSTNQTNTDLHILGLEQHGHVLDNYRELLSQYEVTPAHLLPELPNHTEVLVAGIRVATQTPPMRSGKRVVFISVEDGTGIADTAFFPEAQHTAGPVIFNAKLLMIAGHTRKSGKRGISITATNAWSLTELKTLRR